MSLSWEDDSVYGDESSSSSSSQDARPTPRLKVTVVVHWQPSNAKVSTNDIIVELVSPPRADAAATTTAATMKLRHSIRALVHPGKRLTEATFLKFKALLAEVGGLGTWADGSEAIEGRLWDLARKL